MPAINLYNYLTNIPTQICRRKVVAKNKFYKVPIFIYTDSADVRTISGTVSKYGFRKRLTSEPPTLFGNPVRVQIKAKCTRSVIWKINHSLIAKNSNLSVFSKNIIWIILEQVLFNLTLSEINVGVLSFRYLYYLVTRVVCHTNLFVHGSKVLYKHMKLTSPTLCFLEQTKLLMLFSCFL